ncbi:MAG TPA: hypothetical protein VNI77_02515 [Nitrososphaera sp.]|nr:hypothetical protein [Nitrososphaera sp.]
MVIGSLSFLLLLHIAVGGQLTSQENTSGIGNSDTVFISAYAQTSDPNLNGTVENNTGNSRYNNSETIRGTTVTFDNGNNKSAQTDRLENIPSLREIRGHVGGMIAEDSTGGVIMEEGENKTARSIRSGEEYVVTGHWRVVANQSILERFVTNLTIARIDGMESHIIIIEDVGPRFDINHTGNIMTSRFPATIYRNNFNLTTVTVPIQLELRGNNIAQFSVDIDDENIDSLPVALQILRLIDEEPLYGTVQIVTTVAS